MNWLDVTLVLFLALTTLLGISRGLMKIVLPSIGLMIGILAAGRYYDALAHRVFSSHSDSAYVLSFALIVLVFVIAAVILANILQKALSLIQLGWIDRLAGAVLCLAISSLLAGAILALLLKYSLAVPTIEDSAVASFLVDKFPLSLSFLPGDFKDVKSFFHR